MLKKAKYTYAGMNQDISKSKRDPKFYFDAENIRIYSKDRTSTASATNEKGTELIFTMPVGQVIIGHAVIEDDLIVFSTNNNGTLAPGLELDEVTKINLHNLNSFKLFSGKLEFRTQNLIETEIYIESMDVKKVYWVDGRNQLRHINIIPKLDLNGIPRAYTQDEATLFDSVPTVEFSAPYVDSFDYGGSHTSGMIQYAYNLISKGGSQTAISPTSELYPINKTKGGGAVNEVVGKIFNVKIDEVDVKYDIIRLYSIKYTSYNVTPIIGVIAEESIGGNTIFTFSDDGRVIRNITPEEFLFLGGTAYKPKHITSKFNRLIVANMTELYFDITPANYDTRAYRFESNSATTVINNKDLPNDIVYSDAQSTMRLQSNNAIVPYEHDCIRGFSTHLYQRNSTTYGATGTNIDVAIVQQSLPNPRNVLKSGEIYRIGIEFYNNRGQTTPPKWICDIKAPLGNLNGLHNTLTVNLRNTSLLTSSGVVGWRILRVERTEADKTILAQGIVNPLIFQNYTAVNAALPTIGASRTLANSNKLKVPSPFMRNLTNLSEVGYPDVKIYSMLHGGAIQQRAAKKYNGNNEDPRGEIHLDEPYNAPTQNSFQETRLFQMYSPDFIFGNISPTDSMKYKVIGSCVNTISNCATWANQYLADTQTLRTTLKRFGVSSLYFNSINDKVDKDNNDQFHQNSRIGGVGGRNVQSKYQYHRKYTFGGFSNSPDTEYNILDAPMLIGTGESSIAYGGQPSKYQFNNNLYSVLADKHSEDSDCLGIVSVNSDCIKSLLMADSSESYLESILSPKVQSATDATGLIEIMRTLSNQYGGNTYEARSRNTYLRIGRYKPITTTSNNIVEAGDTFVGNFSFARIMQNPTQIIDAKYYVMTEIVEFLVETSIDISNRNDLSIKGWDSKFMPSFDEYHDYNPVYSQQPTFNSTTATPFTFTLTRYFPHKINATKVKVNGELVDSWTDILINEEMYLDGKYGAINKLIRSKDEVYAFQDQAIANIQISPRVQTVATDGVGIELGIGNVLYTHVYISTVSGSVNSQCVFASPDVIYYLDLSNKTINKVEQGRVVGLSDPAGLHSFLHSSVDYNTLKYNNSVVGVFDHVSNDAYFTTPQFTLAYNEAINSFTSRYSFIPSRYIFSHHGLHSVYFNNAQNTAFLHKHGNGPVGTFYGVKYPSYITFIFNPEPDGDCVFNNIEFKSEAYVEGNDVPTETLKKIHCWNEYQDSGEIDLVVGRNISRRYRDWNLYIPRVQGSPLQRMRGQWIYCKLEYDNALDYNMIIHDILLSYDSIQKSH
jgi:hypothetical protein